MSLSSETMCERCDGLCCRVYDIFDTDSGAHVKPAGQKCGYLDLKNRCRIHTSREKHAGYKNSCETYDCMEGGPLVTIFARRVPITTKDRSSIISSLLETIRLRIMIDPIDRDGILDFVAKLLNSIKIDDSLLLSVKVARVKIERWARV